MSDVEFSKQDERWQKEIRKMISDLNDSLSISNVEWNEWETEFIDSLADKLSFAKIMLTPKQVDALFNLWEKL